MTSSCNINSNTISHCEELAGFLKTALIEDNQNSVDNQVCRTQKLTELSIWNQEHLIQLQNLENGKLAPDGYVWHDGTLRNCKTLSKAKFGIITRNCNDTDMLRRKCTGCGYGKCTCTAGLSFDCGRCKNSYKYNSLSRYQNAYNIWLEKNPKPVVPAEYVRMGDFGGLICQNCIQCASISDINANNVNLNNALTQSMNCIANMKKVKPPVVPPPSPPPVVPPPSPPPIVPPSPPVVLPIQTNNNNILIMLIIILIVFLCLIGALSFIYIDDILDILS